MDLAEIPVLSLDADRADLPARIGESFRTFGFAMIRDHGIDQAL
ncbi:MAG TPA: isopenicillin N synthase family oxygenase, partial [Novosphingobium sp.]|nr:isopenicillin N synthase family oxygenase [Novosphingobium sp.]